MSLLVQHLLLLPTLFIAGALTIVLPAWKVTTFLAGVAFGSGLTIELWAGSAPIFTWTIAAFFVVAMANVIVVAAGPPDPSSKQEKVP